MSKKNAQKRKELEEEKKQLKKKLKLVERDIELMGQMMERKYDSGLYKPGKDFESRMQYQDDPEFLEAAREHDRIQSEFELMKLEQQKKMYKRDLADVVGQLSARD